MKKVLLSLVCGLVALASQAQLTNYSVGQTAPDFTVTDVHGGSHNLYNITSGGQYVLVDFFFVTCGPCQGTAPILTEFYQKYGCNAGDVYAISIDNGYSTQDVLGFEQQYSGANGAPAVSGNDGGGNAVNSTYGPSAYPTFVLIGPDNKFINIDIWPVNSIADLENAFPQGVLNEMACATGLEDGAGYATELRNVYPNPAATTTTIDFSLSQAQEVRFEVFDLLGKKVSTTEPVTYDAGAHTADLPVGALSAGNYIVNFVAGDNVKGIQKLMIVK